MQKYLSIILTCVLAVILSGCGEEGVVENMETAQPLVELSTPDEELKTEAEDLDDEQVEETEVLEEQTPEAEEDILNEETSEDSSLDGLEIGEELKMEFDNVNKMLEELNN